MQFGPPLAPILTVFEGDHTRIRGRMKPPETRHPSSARTSFEALADSAPDAILTIDADSVILTANPATERVFGYNRDELVGQTLTMLIPERLRASHNNG